MMPVPSHGGLSSITFAKIEVHNVSATPISEELWIHQEACNKGYEKWWIFRGLLCQIALQERVFVPFAEATKTVLPVTSELVGILAVKTNTARLSSENEASGFSPE